MKKLFSKLIKKYVRIFPYWKKAVICPLAEECRSACPCADHKDEVYEFDFESN